MKRKTAYLGVMLALALICSYVEVLIPVPIGIPGIKLGLANIVTVFAMYSLGMKDAFLISVMRVTISGFMFGNVVAIAYAMTGAMFSLAIMYLLKKTDKLSCISVSIAGGIAHNMGQMLIAAILVDNYYVLYYVPVLMIAGFITGACIGVVSQEVFLRIGNRMRVR